MNNKQSEMLQQKILESRRFLARQHKFTVTGTRDLKIRITVITVITANTDHT